MQLTEFRKLVEGLNVESFEDEATRLEAVRETQRLLRRLSTPLEVAKRIVWIEPTSHSAIRMAVDMGVFDHLKPDESSETAHLADKCSVNSVLMGRTLRHLASNDYIQECGEGLWRSTPFSAALAGPGIRSMFPYEAGLRPMQRLPEFFREKGYREPDFDAHSPWKFGWDTELDFFDWLLAHPHHLDSFMAYMGAYGLDRKSFALDYPCEERLVRGFDSSRSDAFIVDIGGGKGHDMAKLIGQVPELPGRVVLQDLPKVLDSAKELDAAVEKVPHDFFSPQPVRGARAYYLHSVLHDWPEGRALDILAALRPALVKGYSKVLIHEIVVPSVGATQTQTAADFIMMYVNGSLERTERIWTDLLAKAGLKITGIWDQGSLQLQSLIEAELA